MNDIKYLVSYNRERVVGTAQFLSCAFISKTPVSRQAQEGSSCGERHQFFKENKFQNSPGICLFCFLSILLGFSSNILEMDKINDLTMACTKEGFLLLHFMVEGIKNTNFLQYFS